MMLNSVSFCLSVEVFCFYFLLNLNESLARWGILGCRFYPFITLNVSFHSLLACRVSAKKSADTLMGGISFICCFLLFLCFLKNIFFCL